MTDFPGRIFEIKAANLKPKEIGRYVKDGRASVIARNHPLGANDLSKKLKLKGSDSHFVIGYRDLNNNPKLVLAELKSAEAE